MEVGLPVFLLTLLYVSTVTQSISFDVESGQIKCMSEELKFNSMTVGRYSVVNPNEGYPLPEHHKINVRMYSEKGNSIHKADNVESGEFAFEVAEDGHHMVCFTAIDHQPVVNVSVDFNWSSGVAAKDWSSVAKKGSVEAMELELKKMEDVVNSIHVEMFLLRLREQEMQKLNRKTNSTMGWLSLVSLFLCLSVAGLQLSHLKSFFEKQKII